MKNQDNRLRLEKRDIVELNASALEEIRAGWTTTISGVTTIINFSNDTLCTSDIK